MNTKLEKLIEAHVKANELFDIIESNKLVRPFISEKQLSNEIFEIAKEKLGIFKFWHKKIVRTGKNTIYPYDDNPENLIIKDDDILWIDFGPIFENFEADFGRTYVIGENQEKIALKNSVEKAWHSARDFYKNKERVTGKDLFQFVESIAMEKGYFFGNNIAGHLIDEFSHYKIHESTPENYICLDNLTDLKSPFNGFSRFWILEIHFIDKNKQFGSFFEQILI
ncbi:M24 family metallopeptidase [Leptospira noguchii]|uniref:Metallopeptidase family M24 n=1 Tax=Leptospira noguchii TaxID=28182 RepID=M6VGS4_9LEPT|nr:M24 family metallopeptidase [Leptospira noguchii]EMO52349.1 metallopeptidase family M24 [Leptospira noguchii]